MNDIFRLSDYLLNKNQKYQSHFYRLKGLLKKNCGEVYRFEEFKPNWDLIQNLALYGPLEAEDFIEQTYKNLVKIWNKKYPLDPKFYSMLISQNKMWSGFEGKSLEEFIYSEEGRDWNTSRRKLQRPTCFELDRDFKRSKSNSLKYELKIRQLLRKHPLIRLEDLRQMKVKNAQSILDRFPYLNLHRSLFLQESSSQLASESAHKAD